VIILVGSTRAAKVDGVRAALEAVADRDARFREAVVEAVDVADVAPVMPMTEAAIVEGARARATAVMNRHTRTGPDTILAIGLEGGVDPVGAGGDHYALKTWAAITDGSRWSYGAGGAVLLPRAVARAVVGGRELGDVVDALAGTPIRGTRGAWGLLTLDLIGRRDAFKLAVVAALAPFYNPALYASDL
jgi:inosine/xanthosine triphosphatase